MKQACEFGVQQVGQSKPCADVVITQEERPSREVVQAAHVVVHSADYELLSREGGREEDQEHQPVWPNVANVEGWEQEQVSSGSQSQEELVLEGP